MKQSQTWILQHGWGCDSSFWSRWNAFAPKETKLQVLDRGYFGHPISLMHTTHKPVVVIAHSFGLHLLPESVFQIAEALIIFSGFSAFHSTAVDLMLKRMEVNPLDVLARFQRKCFLPSKSILQTIPSKINQTLLLDDLRCLKQSQFDIKNITNIPKSVIIHGDDDRIVHLERAQELHRQLPNSKLLIVEKAGHALPITHAEWCCQTIQKVLKQ